jgi:predicted ATP-dependent endonuclease of OLD family
MLKLQSDVIEVAQRTQRNNNAWHIAKESNGRTEFAINSYVLVAYPRGLGDHRRPPTKLNTPWRGPLRVLRSHEEGRRYILLNLITNKEEIHHVSTLRAFIFDPMRIDPKDVAMSDQLEYWIDTVIAHRGNTRRVNDPQSPFELKIRWTGFDESKDSWEPWANVRLVDVVHDYLRDNNLARLIPKNLEE